MSGTGPEVRGGGKAPERRPAPRDPDEVARHEAHLVGQIYHLIEANQKLEEQLDRLTKVTEIAALFREKRITRDTFELPPPQFTVPAESQQAWARIEGLVDRAMAPRAVQGEGKDDEERAEGRAGQREGGRDAERRVPAPSGSPPADPEALAELREALGIVRAQGWQVHGDWLSDVRARLVAAEQSIAFLNEQTRELDMLRREKDSIVDGAARLEQNIDDMWKALNEKTTHIQRLESQLDRIWSSVPYRAWRAVKKALRREKRPER